MYVFYRVVSALCCMISGAVMGTSFIELINKSFILVCMYLAAVWPFLTPPLNAGLVAAALLAGGFIQFFLLRKKKAAFLFPALCVAAEVVCEVLYQIIIHGKSYDESYMVFILYGVLLMYVHLGTHPGWAVHQMLLRGKRD